MTEPAAHGRPASERSDDAATLAWVERIGEFFETNYSMPPIMGRIIGWLLICDPPEQSAADIAQAIRASRASLTTNLRLLVGASVIRRLRRAGERTALYRIDNDAWEAVVRRRVAGLTAIEGLVGEGLQLIGPASQRAARLRATHEVFAWLGSLIDNAPSPRPGARN